MLELIIWNLINKFNLINPLKIFSNSCKACGRKYSEIFIDYFLDEQIQCRKCKFKAKIYTKFISIALNFICNALKMPKNQFKQILKNNLSMKRLLLSYLEGIGNFGLRIPQPPGGPVITLWSITNRCNLNCTHCYIHNNTKEPELTFNQACKVIDQLYNARNMIIGFSGGEPLLRNDIFDIIKYASGKNMSVALATNGILINQNIANELKDVGTGYVQVSIDGVNGLHDKIRGKGVFQNAVQGIKKCLKAGLYVSMDVVITKLNVHQIYDLIELAKDLKIQKFEILDFVPSEKAMNMGHLALDPIEMEKFGKVVCDIWENLILEDYPLTLSYKNPIFSRILSQRHSNNLVMPFFKGIFPKNALKFFDFSNRLSKGIFKEQNPFSPFITGCESGIYTIHIKPNGEITPCPLNPLVLGNVRKNNIQDIWLYSPELNQYRKLQFEGYCGKCTYKTICSGCRAKVFLDSGSCIQSDQSCFLTNNLKIKNCQDIH